MNRENAIVEFDNYLRDLGSLPGMKTLRLPPLEMWAGKFHVPFGVLNGAVRRHFLQHRLAETQCELLEQLPGFVRYEIKYDEVGTIGEVYVQDLPDDYSRLSFVPPFDPKQTQGWTSQQLEVIQSQPGREAKLQVMQEMAEADADRKKRLQKYQDWVFILFLRTLLVDPDMSPMSENLTANLERFARYIESEMRMSFWKYEAKQPKQPRQWIEKPESRAQDLLLTFLNGKFGDSIYAFEEVRAGAGFIDILVISPSNEKVIIELKMCGNRYSSMYARKGFQQLSHYVKNKNAEVGCLLVFDSRLRDFGKRFIKGWQEVDNQNIYVLVVDVRPFTENVPDDSQKAD